MKVFSGRGPAIRFALFLKLVLFATIASSCSKRTDGCAGPFVAVPMSFAIEKVASYELPPASAVLPATFSEKEPLGIYTIRVATDGHVCDVTRVRSSEGLVSTVIEDAIKKWRFRPTLVLRKEQVPIIAKSTWFLYAKRENGRTLLVIPGLKER